jgi:hypothetical protein
MNATQLTFEERGAGQSQNAKILARLKATPGVDVPMPELERISGSHRLNSRAADLRRQGKKEGFQIFCRTTHEGGTVKSFYRLEYIEQP